MGVNMSDFTFLTDEQVFGENRLAIFEKYRTEAYILPLSGKNSPVCIRLISFVILLFYSWMYILYTLSDPPAMIGQGSEIEESEIELTELPGEVIIFAQIVYGYPPLYW